MSKKVKELVATCLYVGYIPGAPGTCASILSAALFATAGRPLHLAGWLVLLGLVLASMWAFPAACELLAARDPREVVLDEAAGMWLTFLAGGTGDWVFMGIGFVLFRVLDIAKPFPISRLERIGGWRGVLADDLLAGLVAGLIIRLAVYFVAV